MQTTILINSHQYFAVIRITGTELDNYRSESYDELLDIAINTAKSSQYLGLQMSECCYDK